MIRGPVAVEDLLGGAQWSAFGASATNVPRNRMAGFAWSPVRQGNPVCRVRLAPWRQTGPGKGVFSDAGGGPATGRSLRFFPAKLEGGGVKSDPTNNNLNGLRGVRLFGSRPTRYGNWEISDRLRLGCRWVLLAVG
jgi:hypothetical protein